MTAVFPMPLEPVRTVLPPAASSASIEASRSPRPTRREGAVRFGTASACSVRPPSQVVSPQLWRGTSRPPYEHKFRSSMATSPKGGQPWWQPVPSCHDLAPSVVIRDHLSRGGSNRCQHKERQPYSQHSARVEKSERVGRLLQAAVEPPAQPLS